ncbi:uncharacterized protein isoform X1 [Leptinotarsa decemlineata]|uniref:uncharacterized protein isoform X1 n=1 Tax=Leptinotarsa decemlineata TaxID=7539 RepID=UPI003D3091C6
MGKKARKTRWRTLPIADEHSDSEESNTTAATRLPQTYQQKSYYNKLPYSSQSTPRRRYQYDGTKSTRSSSTASENKITFNEDEYTRITTPRQDVLFKKGYLNKPRSYQTQTSTGTSTTSTGNSTGNGTPDHQSTDLDYESQFVFPNGFVDQNGIYYVNSFEPYPLMLYNPPTYYNEFLHCKSKRCSTGSLSESTSPHNEEVTSQDLSGGEASNNVSDYSSHHSVYNMVYPGYYVNEVQHPQDVIEQCPAEQNRKVKKRIRRKTSKSQISQGSTECSDEESDSYNENDNPSEKKVNPQCFPDPNRIETISEMDSNKTLEEVTLIVANDDPKDDHQTSKHGCDERKEDCEKSTDDNNVINNNEINRNVEDLKNNSTGDVNLPEENNSLHDPPKTQKYDLKPDAEEFIPRAYRTPEIPLSPVQFIKVSPNFVPIPVVPFNGQNFNPAFIPSGIPINFLPPDPKMFPNFVGFIPNIPKSEEETENRRASVDNNVENQNAHVCQSNNIIDDQVVKKEEKNENKLNNNKTIDLAKIVSKLEEAVKKQEDEETKTENTEKLDLVKRKPFDKQFNNNQKYKNNHKRGFYNSPRNSPQRKIFHQNNDDGGNRILPFETETTTMRSEKESVKNSSESRKNWKPHNENVTTKWQPHGLQRSSEFKPNQSKRFYSQTVQNAEIKPTVKHGLQNLEVTLSNEKPVKHCEVDVNVKTYSSQIDTPELTLSPTKTSSPTKKQNQWISVSSRKKRKSKNTEESETSFDGGEDEHSLKDDNFESYDVSLLVDVIPTPKEDVVEIEIKNGKIEEIINIISQTEPNMVENIHMIPNIKSVTEIESEMVVDVDKIEISNGNGPSKEIEEQSELVEDTEKSKNVSLSEDDKIEVSKQSQIEPVSGIIEESHPNKDRKKSKKGTQKPLTKKVMITDIDLSENCEEIKEPIKKIVKKTEKTEDKIESGVRFDEKLVETNKNKEHTIKSMPTDEKLPVKDTEDEKKTSKKRKKKSSKTSMVSNVGSATSPAVGKNLVDSFDYLLESSLVGESDKTNDDISQELDKMIQKGMYSCLEGKIKSLNIDESDGFFKSIFSKISSRETSIEKTGYSKSPDFTKIPLFVPVSVSEATSLDNIKANKNLPASESPKEDGFFLENPEIREMLKDQTKDKEEKSTDVDEGVEVDDQKTRYPITKAVKEWMSKTRETTPDAEILKSPKTIYKEYCESVGGDKDTEVHVFHKLPDLNLSANYDDDEITLFSTKNNLSRRESGEQDLLEFWEDEVNNLNDDEKQDNVEIIPKVNHREDVLEVYESKYGNNEDYLKLQKEIKETIDKTTYPKHGNLPYRAICCNIM